VTDEVTTLVAPLRGVTGLRVAATSLSRFVVKVTASGLEKGFHFRSGKTFLNTILSENIKP
jgi:hypothetical protein